MTARSAGIVVYRHGPDGLEFLIVHPGGPYWAKKDDGAWSIPKGEHGEDEDAVAVARRELLEETGLQADGELIPLEPIRQRSGKVVTAWGLEADWDPARLRSNTFRIEWPPRSGKMAEFPEVDRAMWATLEQARAKLNPSQVPLLEELAAKLKS
jgi:predicted NUDIX family NTP pyrophosphohydrolase